MKFYTHNFEFDAETDQQFMLFALFHDIVYDPKAEKGLNEKQSADIFQQFAEEFKLDQPSKDFVSNCILDTISHKPHDPESKVVSAFLDCDLSILAHSDEKYLQYSKDIKFEYSHFSDEDYSKGRTSVLETFLK